MYATFHSLRVNDNKIENSTHDDDELSFNHDATRIIDGYLYLSRAMHCGHRNIAAIFCCFEKRTDS